MLRRTTPSCVRPRARPYTAKAQAPKEGGDGTQGKPRIHHRIKQWATKIADKETAAVVKRRVTEAGSQATQASTAALKSVAGLLEPIRKRAGVHSEQWFKTLVDRTMEGVREAAWYQSQKEQSIEWLKALYGGIEGKAHQSIDHIGPLLRMNHNRKFYEKGWGNREVITYMYDMIDKPKVFLESNRPRQLDIKWVREEFKPECLVADGKFEAPLARFLPLESQTAHFRIIVPRQGKDPVFTTDALTSTMRNRPRMCILLGGTGDHGFGLRQTFFAKRLLKYNIGSIILENPFYGTRKPKDQSGSCLLHVSDIMLLGSSIIVEANALADWLESEGRYGGVGFAGMSMGGINSCLAAAVGNRPLALAPLIAPYSAGPVFTKGVISKVCDWDTLTKQLPEYAPPDVKTAPEYMLKLLDDLTDLRNYPVPRHPEFVVQVRAKHDMYVPEGYDLREFWPGSEVRHVSAGHISAVAMGFLPQFDVFNSAIVDSFDKLDAYRRREGLPTAASA